MYVAKRDGRNESLKFDKIKARLNKLTYGISLKRCDPITIARKVCVDAYNGITTTQLDHLAAEIAFSVSRQNSNYDLLATRIAVSSLHKNTKKSFSATIKDLYNHFKSCEIHFLGDHVYKIIMENAAQLDSEIIYDRDFDYDYITFKEIEKSCLIRIDGKVVERPQHMLMKIAVGVHRSDIDSVIKTYHLMSRIV